MALDGPTMQAQVKQGLIDKYPTIFGGATPKLDPNLVAADALTYFANAYGPEIDRALAAGDVGVKLAQLVEQRYTDAIAEITANRTLILTALTSSDDYPTFLRKLADGLAGA